MTQPPYGQYPPPYGHRAPSGPPPAGYGRFGLTGQPLPSPPPPPPEKRLLPWLIVGGAVLVSALGLLLVLLLRGNDGSAAPAAANSTAVAPSSPAGAGPSRPEHSGLPGGARVADEDTGVGQARFDGSGDVALGWVQAMADGDFQTAFDLSCADVQQAAVGAAVGDDPARTLGTYFFEQTLSGRGFTDGSFDSMIYSSESDSDIGSFTLELDDGEEFLLLVYVQADGKVCDFV